VKNNKRLIKKNIFNEAPPQKHKITHDTNIEINTIFN
jgi:hypothetical protein